MSKFLLIFLMLANANSFAAVSKWVDDQGQVHYSDQVPSNSKAKTLRPTSDAEVTSGASGVVPSAAPKTIAEREAGLKKTQQAKQADADKAAKDQAAADTLKANCASAQQNLRTLQSGMRTVQIDANGARSYMDDTQRQQSIEKIQQDINSYCK